MNAIYKFALSVGFFMLAIVSSSGQAFGQAAGGLVIPPFEVETKGLEYCGDFNFAKFGYDAGETLWMSLGDFTEFSIARTEDFDPETTYPLIGKSYFTDIGQGAVTATAQLDDGSSMIIVAKWAVDESFAITKLTGRLIEHGVFTEGCFSDLKFRVPRPAE